VPDHPNPTPREHTNGGANSTDGGGCGSGRTPRLWQRGSSSTELPRLWRRPSGLPEDEICSSLQAVEIADSSSTVWEGSRKWRQPGAAMLWMNAGVTQYDLKAVEAASGGAITGPEAMFRGGSVHAALKAYSARSGEEAEARRRQREAELAAAAEPPMLCCRARAVLIGCSAMLALLALAVLATGVILLHEATREWGEVPGLRLAGTLLIVSAVFVGVLACSGIAAGRTRSAALESFHFGTLLVCVALVATAATFLLWQRARAETLLRCQWELADTDAAQQACGSPPARRRATPQSTRRPIALHPTNSPAQAFTFEDVLALLHSHYAAAIGIGSTAFALLVLELAAACRVLSPVALARCLLGACATLGLVGLFTAASHLSTVRALPIDARTATNGVAGAAVLAAAAAAQLGAAVVGVSGLRLRRRARVALACGMLGLSAMTLLVVAIIGSDEDAADAELVGAVASPAPPSPPTVPTAAATAAALVLALALLTASVAAIGVVLNAAAAFVLVRAHLAPPPRHPCRVPALTAPTLAPGGVKPAQMTRRHSSFSPGPSPRVPKGWSADSARVAAVVSAARARRRPHELTPNFGGAL